MISVVKRSGLARWVVAPTLGLAALMAVSTGWGAQQNDECQARQFEMGLRYQQQSAEIGALQRQTYRLASQRLEQLVDKAGKGRPLAIMTDLDETAIDNSGLYVNDVGHCHDFTQWDTWDDWERHGHPRAIPGALDFLRTAQRLGVTVFYVSDRTDANKQATMATLKQLGFPQVTAHNVRLAGPSKQVRRQDIQRHYRLVMQLGDSLADFAGDFKGAGLSTQRQLVQREASHFGNDWFIFPNAAYGSWTRAQLSRDPQR